MRHHNSCHFCLGWPKIGTLVAHLKSPFGVESDELARNEYVAEVPKAGVMQSQRDWHDPEPERTLRRWQDRRSVTLSDYTEAVSVIPEICIKTQTC